MVAGVPFFDEVFRQLDCTYVSLDLLMLGWVLSFLPFLYQESAQTYADRDGRVEWHVREGETFEPVKHCATVRGPIRKILLGERVALNTLARCSGIATKYVLLKLVVSTLDIRFPYLIFTHPLPLLLFPLLPHCTTS